MNAASKVDAILNAWFDYIALEDYSNAKIEANSDAIKQRGVSPGTDGVTRGLKSVAAKNVCVLG